MRFVIFPECRHRDGRAGDMRRPLERRFRIGDALFDAARRKRNEKRFSRSRRAHQARRFLIGRQIGITRKLLLRKRRISINRIRRVRNRFRIRLDALFRPLVDTGRHELIIPLLTIRHIRRDVRIRHPAIFQRFLRHVIQLVFSVFDKSLHTRVLAVLPVQFRREQILLFLNGRAFSFENRGIRPVQKFFRRARIVVIREIVIEETAIRLQRHPTVFGNDAVDVEIAGCIFDVDIPIRARFEAVIRPFRLPRLHLERCSIRPANHAAGDELDAISAHDGIRLLDDIAPFGLHDGRLAGRDIADIDSAAQDIDAEVLPRFPGNTRRVRANERVLRACISRGIKRQAPCLDIARRRLLDDILPGQRRRTGAVLHHPVEIHILTAAVDIDRTAIRIPIESDSDIVICLHGILRDIRIARFLHQRILILFRKPKRIRETLRALFKRYRRRIPYIFRRGNFVSLACRCIRADIILRADKSTAFQHMRIPRRCRRHRSTLRYHFFSSRRFILNAPPIHTRFIDCVCFDIALVHPNLIIVVATRCRAVDTGILRVPRFHRIARNLPVHIILDGHHNLPIRPRIRRLSRDISRRAIQVGNLDLALLAFAGRQRLNLQILIGMIFHRDAAVAVKRFDSCFRRIIRRIQNRPDERNMPAAEFCILHHKAIRFPIVADAVNRISALVGDEERMFLRLLRDGRHILFLAAVHIVDLIAGRNFHGLCRRAALDLGIDIEIARADENISVRLDAGIIKRRFAPVDIHRIAAHARDTAVRLQIRRLDVISVLHVDFD